MFESIGSLLQSFITDYGFIGVFLAMLTETIIPPIPSEIVMPLAGYIAFSTGMGYFGLLVMSISGTLGSTVGAVVIYMIARIGGRRIVLKYGRYVSIDSKKIAAADNWFARHGSKAVFLCRMVPGLRELISLPAGFSRMNFTKFMIMTLAGSFIWTLFLGAIGFYLGSAWSSIDLGSYTNIVAAMVILSIASYFIFRHFLKKRKE